MSFVLIEKARPHVALVTLNRPERMNAMAFDVMVPLRQALEEVGQDNDVRVVVLTGAGSGFCAGADLEDAGPVPDIDGLTRPGIARRAMGILDDVVLALRRMPQPVIGAINGPAIGGGFCLSLATDIRIASDLAYFCAAGIKNGLTATELGMSYLLPRAIGSSRAFEIMISGRDVDAEEAARIGLVSHTTRNDCNGYTISRRYGPTACAMRSSPSASDARTVTCRSPRRTVAKASITPRLGYTPSPVTRKTSPLRSWAFR
ncbi:MAG TPA: enoyl-CoA hydratase-related protein [Acidimicrobiales bacterium]|nr:enoyl-CoA hydratase-related protein [Acidimicrobiales bacterium]